MMKRAMQQFVVAYSPRMYYHEVRRHRFRRPIGVIPSTSSSSGIMTLLSLLLLLFLLLSKTASLVQGSSKTSVTEQGECQWGKRGICQQNQQQQRRETEMNHSSSSLVSNSKCTLYLAPSTIPGAGLGVFTTIAKKKGDTVGQGDVFIPMLEVDGHNDKANKRLTDPSFTIFNPFLDYVWTGESMGMAFEVVSNDVVAMCPGLDAAINCNLALINVGKALPMWDDGGLHRSRDPGAGALTPYHNGSTPIILRDIPAGGELFKHYGDWWFETRPSLFKTAPLTDDYPRAQRILDAFGRLMGIQKQQTSVTESSNITSSSSSSSVFPVPLQRDLWTIVIDFPFTSRTMNALPETLQDAWVAIQDELAAVYQPFAIRNESYLEENGKCMDHIKPGRSNIAQAGHGAFAVRPLKRGTIISGSPLLHLPHYQVLHMYGFHKNENEGQWKRNKEMNGQQIMLNYCFGHTQSTLLLCPYGGGVPYINHNQTLANVRVQWSKHGSTNQNDTWFNLTPPQMEWLYRPNLALDYIALRDIEEGEELFLDYGDAFEAAWQNHLMTWEPRSTSYASAHDFNLQMSESPIRTEHEQKFDPYPFHLQIRCHSILSNYNWRQNVGSTSIMWPLNEKGHSCRILHRFYEGNADFYEVLVFQLRGTADEATQYTRSRVPRQAIAFRDMPYTTDLHLRNAFRFPIMIPDDIFPDAWRNAEPHNFTNGSGCNT
jgi:hypothetical protein